jgi:hypothetical protein
MKIDTKEKEKIQKKVKDIFEKYQKAFKNLSK